MSLLPEQKKTVYELAKEPTLKQKLTTYCNCLAAIKLKNVSVVKHWGLAML